MSWNIISGGGRENIPSGLTESIEAVLFRLRKKFQEVIAIASNIKAHSDESWCKAVEELEAIEESSKAYAERATGKFIEEFRNLVYITTKVHARILTDKLSGNGGDSKQFQQAMVVAQRGLDFTNDAVDPSYLLCLADWSLRAGDIHLCKEILRFCQTEAVRNNLPMLKHKWSKIYSDYRSVTFQVDFSKQDLTELKPIRISDSSALAKLLAVTKMLGKDLPCFDYSKLITCNFEFRLDKDSECLVTSDDNTLHSEDYVESVDMFNGNKNAEISTKDSSKLARTRFQNKASNFDDPDDNETCLTSDSDAMQCLEAVCFAFENLCEKEAGELNSELGGISGEGFSLADVERCLLREMTSGAATCLILSSQTELNCLSEPTDKLDIARDSHPVVKSFDELKTISEVDSDLIPLLDDYFPMKLNAAISPLQLCKGFISAMAALGSTPNIACSQVMKGLSEYLPKSVLISLNVIAMTAGCKESDVLKLFNENEQQFIAECGYSYYAFKRNNANNSSPKQIKGMRADEQIKLDDICLQILHTILRQWCLQLPSLINGSSTEDSNDKDAFSLTEDLKATNKLLLWRQLWLMALCFVDIGIVPLDEYVCGAEILLRAANIILQHLVHSTDSATPISLPYMSYKLEIDAVILSTGIVDGNILSTILAYASKCRKIQAFTVTDRNYFGTKEWILDLLRVVEDMDLLQQFICETVRIDVSKPTEKPILCTAIDTAFAFLAPETTLNLLARILQRLHGLYYSGSLAISESWLSTFFTTMQYMLSLCFGSVQDVDQAAAAQQCCRYLVQFTIIAQERLSEAVWGPLCNLVLSLGDRGRTLSSHGNMSHYALYFSLCANRLVSLAQGTLSSGTCFDVENIAFIEVSFRYLRVCILQDLVKLESYSQSELKATVIAVLLLSIRLSKRVSDEFPGLKLVKLSALTVAIIGQLALIRFIWLNQQSTEVLNSSREGWGSIDIDKLEDMDDIFISIEKCHNLIYGNNLHVVDCGLAASRILLELSGFATTLLDINGSAGTISKASMLDPLLSCAAVAYTYLFDIQFVSSSSIETTLTNGDSEDCIAAVGGRMSVRMTISLAMIIPLIHLLPQFESRMKTIGGMSRSTIRLALLQLNSWMDSNAMINGTGFAAIFENLSLETIDQRCGTDLAKLAGFVKAYLAKHLIKFPLLTLNEPTDQMRSTEHSSLNQKQASHRRLCQVAKLCTESLQYNIGQADVWAMLMYAVADRLEMMEDELSETIMPTLIPANIFLSMKHCSSFDLWDAVCNANDVEEVERGRYLGIKVLLRTSADSIIGDSDLRVFAELFIGSTEDRKPAARQRTATSALGVPSEGGSSGTELAVEQDVRTRLRSLFEDTNDAYGSAIARVCSILATMQGMLAILDKIANIVYFFNHDGSSTSADDSRGSTRRSSNMLSVDSIHLQCTLAVHYYSFSQLVRGNLSAKQQMVSAALKVLLRVVSLPLDLEAVLASKATGLQLSAVPFCFTFAGKLCYQNTGDCLSSLNYLQQAVRLLSCEAFRSEGYLKQLRMNVMYQICSITSRHALNLLESAVTASFAVDGNICFHLENAIVSASQLATGNCLKYPDIKSMVATELAAMEVDNSLGPDSSIVSLWNIIIGSLFYLRDCRKLDPFDTFSIYRISVILRSIDNLTRKISPVTANAKFLAQLASSGSQVLPALHIKAFSTNSAFIEMRKLFDKRRPQVVAIWCLNSASQWWDKVLQRTAKFDALRRKIVVLYLSLLLDMARDTLVNWRSLDVNSLGVVKVVSCALSDLICWTRNSKQSHSTVSWIASMVDAALKKYVCIAMDAIIPQGMGCFPRALDEQQEAFTGSTNLTIIMQAVFGLYVATKKKISTTSRLLLEKLILAIFDAMSFSPQQIIEMAIVRGISVNQENPMLLDVAELNYLSFAEKVLRVCSWLFEENRDDMGPGNTKKRKKHHDVASGNHLPEQDLENRLFMPVADPEFATLGAEVSNNENEVFV